MADDGEDNLSEKEKIEEQKYMSTLCSSKPGVDKEGRWVKKGGKYSFGYKKHVVTTKEGLGERTITNPANLSDTREFKDLIDKLKLPETVVVLADKGYASQDNSAHLVEKGLADKTVKKTNRGKPLEEEGKSLIDSSAKPGARLNGHLVASEDVFKGGQCRYGVLQKAHAQNVLEAICYNIKRAPNMIIQLAPTAQ